MKPRNNIGGMGESNLYQLRIMVISFWCLIPRAAGLEDQLGVRPHALSGPMGPQSGPNRLARWTL